MTASSGTEHVLLLVGVAVGIIAGFVAWTFVSPLLSSVPATPGA